MKFWIFVFLALWVGQASFAQTFDTLNIHFATASDELDEHARLQLLRLATSNRKASFTLIGHTDSRGDNKFNLGLSKKRVQNVADYLSFWDISDSLISVQFVGETKPKVSNQHEKGMAKNRRVEVLLTKGLVPQVALPDSIQDLQKVACSKHINHKKLSSILSEMVIEQEFIIQTHIENTIKTTDGTIIYFPANSFQSTSKQILLKVIDYNTRKSMFLGNVQTVCDGKPIVSFGMFELQAFEDNKEIRMRNGSRFTALFPYPRLTEIPEGIYSFYADRTPRSGFVNWEKGASEELPIIDGADWSDFFEYRTITKREKQKGCFLKTFFSSASRYQDAIYVEEYLSLAKVKQAYPDLNPTEIAKLIDKAKAYFMFQSRGSVAQMFNCDMVMWLDKVEAPRITFRVKLEDGFSDNTIMAMMLKDARGMIYPDIITDTYAEFSNIPVNASFDIIGLKLLPETNQFKLGIQASAGYHKEINLALEHIKSESELEARLVVLN